MIMEFTVHDALRKAAAVHARHRAVRFLLRALLVVLLAVPLLMVADVLFHFSEIPRLAGGIAIILAAVASLVVAFGLACFARPPALRVARLLESRNPALGSKLVNILQLEADAAKGDTTPLTRSLAKRAVADAAKALDLPTLPSLAREPRLKTHARTLAITAAVLTLITIFGGPHVRHEWLRFVDPFGDHPPFSLTRLEILKPTGGADVLFGGSFTIEARASGHQPSELFLTATPADPDAVPVTLPMSARGDGTFVARLENIIHPMELVAHTANQSARSHRRMLGLILTPQFGEVRVTLTPPEYTGQKPREMPYRFTALQVLEGTGVQFQIASNRPLGDGTIQFEISTAPPTQIPLAPANGRPPTTARANLTAEESGRLTFFLADADGHRADENPTCNLTVARDQPPAIAVTAPENDALVVEAFTVPILIDATDDFGLSSMRLHIAVNDEFLPLDAITFDAPDTRRHRIEHTLDLAAHDIKAGDRITIFAEAIDTRPDPQIARTTMRRLKVITEDDYNEMLRTKSDVAMIAGKYEDLVSRLENHIAGQERIEKELAAIRERAAEGAAPEEVLRDFSRAVAAQHELNQSLDRLADEMEEFGRDNPIYDFENELQEKFREQADAIRETVERQNEQTEAALEAGPPPPDTPNEQMMRDMELAAREQRESLQGEQMEAGRDVVDALQDLALLHELMKDFNRFEQLAREQQELAEQSKAYQDKPDLNAEDRLALRDLGARQRNMAGKLEQLARKLEHDAKAAEEKFPDAASSARQLALRMDAAAMPGLARDAAQNMLEARANDAHAQARKLHEEMQKLFGDPCEPGQQGLADAIDHALRLQRGMNPGDSLRQMMLSQNFRPLPGQAGAAGVGGFNASSAMDAQDMLLGGESFMNGPIADALSGRGDGAGQGLGTGPTTSIDRADRANVDRESARRTSTPGTTTLLMEYENLADAYFRRLTTKP